jgi:hypothetical protein
LPLTSPTSPCSMASRTASHLFVVIVLQPLLHPFQGA